jgi:3-oxoacyl-(acyl-carrier-protein) synthase
LVSVVINCLCHRTGTIPGNVNSTAPMEHQRVVISSNPHRRGVHSSIVIASGFGGPTATVCLKQHQ